MKEEFDTLISKGKTQKAIELLLSTTSKLEDKDLYQEAILQSARFEEYAKQKRMGVTSHEQGGISIATINKALLDIANQLPHKSSTSSLSENNSNKAKENTIDSPPSGMFWKWVVGLGLLITIPAGIADFTGYSIKDIFSTKQTSSAKENTSTPIVDAKSSKKLPLLIEQIFSEENKEKRVLLLNEKERLISTYFNEQSKVIEDGMLLPEGFIPVLRAAIQRDHKIRILNELELVNGVIPFIEIKRE